MATQKVTVELSEPVFEQLTRIARATQQPLEVLAAQSIASNLPPTQRQELSELRINADKLMLQKAYAWSVLRWRGHRISSVDELPE